VSGELMSIVGLNHPLQSLLDERFSLWGSLSLSERKIEGENGGKI
jgi:hypothetical protein